MIRQALGSGARDPLPLEEFAARLLDVTGRKYDPSQLSKLERGKQRLSVQIAEDIALVDPKQRGPWWIAWGVEISGDVRGDETPRPLPPAEFVPRPAGPPIRKPRTG